MQEKFLAAVETERWRPVHAGFKSGFIVLKDLTPGALPPPSSTPPAPGILCGLWQLGEPVRERRTADPTHDERLRPAPPADTRKCLSR